MATLIDPITEGGRETTPAAAWDTAAEARIETAVVQYVFGRTQVALSTNSR